ncbi:MAG: aminodeoxychorismate synthase component I [Campylobacterales bacterium]|nr:aminodeoxychorismate synthase component I [Campylobacterales bacterium]
MGFELLNTLGKQREPFLFICDYKAKSVDAIKLSELDDRGVAFMIDAPITYERHKQSFHTMTSVAFESYKKKFDAVIEKIKAGETYILNLTQPTDIQTSLSLKEIFELANAKYKLYYKDEFVCFSPETFIKINNDTIHTFPMKGTIDASLDNAEELILSNTKEMAEHVMVVDLLRNDLSMVAEDVKVEHFRYVEKISAGERALLQVSSHISGMLHSNWHENIGTILQTLLPAGSITGAPKKSTIEIIEKIEGYNRGHFSGVFGVYDGEKLDSAVMIRFIEKSKEGFIYKSGGGITLDSNATLEYQEYQDKVYLP